METEEGDEEDRMIEKMLIFNEAWECGHRLNGLCEHPDRPGTERVCPPGIAFWCPLPDAQENPTQ